MNERYTIYTLNENCIADSLTADLEEKQRLAVPHLSVLNGAFSDITNGRTDALIAGDFLDDGRLSVWYDENTKKMYLGGKNQYMEHKERVISLDCSPFIVDGMINSVSVVNEDPTTTPPTHGVFIEIIWNTDSGHAPTYINVKNVIGGLYTGDGKYINVDENLSISFDSGKFIKNFKENSDGLSNTYDTLFKNYQFLAGLDGDYTSGAIGQMSSDIENLKDNGINGLKYLKDIDDAVELGASDSLSSFLQSKIGDSIENGTYLPVKFDEDTTIELDDGLKVCNGDAVIIHVDGNTRYIPVESIKLGINASVQKGGVSRYEYNENKDNISQLRTDVDTISNDVSSISGYVGEISGYVGEISGKVDEISGYVGEISGKVDEISGYVGEISGKVDEISGKVDEISGKVDEISGKVDEISGKVDNKIFIVNPEVNLSDYSDLSVVKLGKEEYETLVASGDSLDQRTIYIVNSEVIDAYGQQIKNISGATDLSDAVNLEQMQQTSSYLQDEIGGISANMVFVPGEGDWSAEQKCGSNPIAPSIETKNRAISYASVAEGALNVAGLKAYRYHNIIDNKILFDEKLSGWEVGDVVSFVNVDKYHDASTIRAINEKMVTFDSLPFISVESDYSSYDYSTAYISKKPDVGNLDMGCGAHAEGINTKALNLFAHSEGYGTSAFGQYSHAEGRETIAYYASHAEGHGTMATSFRCHAEGMDTQSSGSGSHAEGQHTVACGQASHAEGHSYKRVAENIQNLSSNQEIIDYWNEKGEKEKFLLAKGTASHAEGKDNLALGNYSHTEGYLNKSIADRSHTEGRGTEAWGNNSHAEGLSTVVKGNGAHAEGTYTLAGVGDIEPNANSTSDEGFFSHAEGNGTWARGNSSHAEGKKTIAWTSYSHAEGMNSSTGTEMRPNAASNANIGVFAHAEGNGTWAKGNSSHAEGKHTIALSAYSHAEGHETSAMGNFSHAQGQFTLTLNQGEHSEGRYNVSRYNSATFGNNKNTIHSIGIGTAESNRKNAVEVMQNGDVYVISVGGYDGNNLTGNTLQQTITNLSGRVDKQKIVDYYNSNNLSGYNRDQWLGLNLHQMGEMLSVLFTAFCG